MIDILKHTSIVVLQDVGSDIKTEAVDYEDIEFKHEAIPTIYPAASVKVEKVRNWWNMYSVNFKDDFY